MKIRNRWVIGMGARVFALAMKGIFFTLRRDIRLAVESTSPYDRSVSKRFLYSVWHDMAVIAAFGGKQPYSAALTSRHDNGLFVTGVLKAIGMPAIRGSTSRGGAAALRQLISAAESQHIVISPDGPRGPRRQMTRGIVFLASQTGHAIVPTAFSCSRCWKIKGSWTDLVIPKPFARVALMAGAPITVPPNLPRDILDEYVHLLQAAMDKLTLQAEQIQNTPPTT